MAFSSDNTSSQGALAGVKVVDLSRVLGGPYCSQILADHGAEVIKVEPPQGDETREWGPPFKDGMSAYFSGANRNKKCIALDLGKAAAREVLFKLLEKADVLLENFKPGTLEKWGLGFDRLQAKFPRLIHCRITGFGEQGPLGAMPGYDAAAQAWTGIMSINGDPASGPTRVALPIIDLGAGLNACIGILAALYERERSGRGQSVGTSLFETGLGLLHPHGANFLMSGNAPKATGSAHTNISPYDLFKTKTTSVFLAIGNNQQFKKFCDHVGRPEMAKDRRYTDNKDRLSNRLDLKKDIEAALAKFDGEVLAEDLIRIGVPAGPVLDVQKAFAHPQAKALEMRKELDGNSQIAPPLRMSRTPPSVRSAPEKFAQSTNEVLKGLGYSEAKIDELKKLDAVLVEIKTKKENA